MRQLKTPGKPPLFLYSQRNAGNWSSISPAFHAVDYVISHSFSGIPGSRQPADFDLPTPQLLDNSARPGRVGAGPKLLCHHHTFFGQ